jgi:formylglycine-generating enzyme required for sulfatase activity
MPSFGRYKTVRELYRIGFVVLYSGRAEDSPEEKFAIKAFQPSALLLEKERAKAESDLFLSSASVQQKVSASGAQHWAPIFEQGLSPDGAFYVTNKYDHSLQQLIDGRVKLTAQTLHAIIESAAKGLIELKQACSRPHGNLKAANVLITGAADFSQTKVVLTDPLPDEYIDTEVHWDTDLRAIAEFIYQFVMHRPSPVSSGWQVPETEEWARLGKQANDWRNLCNRLLNACTKPGAMTVETLLEELAKLKAAKPVPTHRYIIAAGLIVTVSTFILWFFFHKPPPPPEVEVWNMLCSEYLDWVEDLHKALGLTTKDSTLAKQWRDEKDTKLTEILDKIKKDASYPYRVVAKNNKDNVNELKDIKTKEELQLLEVKDSETKTAVSAVNDIKSFFDPNSDKVWPLLRRINEDAKNYSGRGWQRPAEYLQNLVDAVRPGPGNKTIPENVDKLLKLDRRGVTREIREYLGGIAKDKTIITGLDVQDPVLAKFDDLVNKEAASGLDEAGEETINKLSENLKGINKLVGELAEEISQIERDIKEGKKSNPKEANKCDIELKSLRQKFVNETIEDIDKNKEDIGKTVDRYKPLLYELKKKAQSTIESAEKYVERIQQLRSIAKSDKINEKWNKVKIYFISEIKRKPELYSDLRQNLDAAKDKLVALDEELQTRLPLQVGAAIGEKNWHQRLRQIYEQEQKDRTNQIVEKIPVKNELPDINEDSFKQYRLDEYSRFDQWRENLTGIVKAFDRIENGLELYYSLDDTLPEVNESINSLWQTWKDKDILKDPRIRDGLNEMISRIDKLVEVRRSGDRQYLAATALNPDSRPEVVYAAWERLGALSDPNWPNRAEDWENDKKIQGTLKTQFEAIKGRNQSRTDELLKILSTAGDKREKVFLIANIGRYRDDIAKNSFQDQTLLRFNEFKPYGPDSDLGEIRDFEVIAKKLAALVKSDDWQNKKFRTDLLPQKPEIVLSIKTFEEWLEETKKYRIIDKDPREKRLYKAAMKYIEDELPTAENPNLKVSYDNIKPDIEKILNLDPIEKNRNDFNKLDGYWEQLQNIQDNLKPKFCKYLNKSKEGQVVFATNAGLEGFEPVKKVDDYTFTPEKVTEWKKIKPEFFYSTDKGDNMGWPKYIRSSKDPSVILAFIPAGRDNLEPFYMAAHEITNAQYCLFLKDVGAKDSGELEGGAMFVGQDRKPLISWASDEEPHGAIKYDKSKEDFVVSKPSNDAPVVWVTFGGANSYAEWLNGRLPTASQYGYACRAGADTKYPWGNDLAQIQLYAHVRAAAWQRAANEYNTTINALSDVAPCPVGAVKKESLEKDNILDTTKIVCKEDGYNYAWPLATLTTTTKPNTWELYNMIGNVWEWCRSDEKSTQTVICGGSCLAPLEYVTPDSKYDFKGQACDVGFRVIVPAK